MADPEDYPWPWSAFQATPGPVSRVGHPSGCWGTDLLVARSWHLAGPPGLGSPFAVFSTFNAGALVSFWVFAQKALTPWPALFEILAPFYQVASHRSRASSFVGSFRPVARCLVRCLPRSLSSLALMAPAGAEIRAAGAPPAPEILTVDTRGGSRLPADWLTWFATLRGVPRRRV